jgi:hypothetical protein
MKFMAPLLELFLRRALNTVHVRYHGSTQDPPRH